MHELELKICHLYPDVLNLYGDSGNILCMKRRLEWRGIDVTVTNCGVGSSFRAAEHDLLFIGGGQDFEQGVMLPDLNEKAAEIRAAVQDGVPFLAICGGFQVLGTHYKTASGTQYDFTGALDLWSVGKKDRLTGDYVFSCEELDGAMVVGFENHAGRTYLGDSVRPLGRVIAGHGNNGDDHTEGARFLNTFATYAHGCVLPKNPALADYILKTALEKKYGTVTLTPLDDTFENRAHDFLVNRMLQK